MIKNWHHRVIKNAIKGTDNYGILNCMFYISICINHYTEYWSIAGYLSNMNGLSRESNNVGYAVSLKAVMLWARTSFQIGSQFEIMGSKMSLRVSLN